MGRRKMETERDVSEEVRYALALGNATGLKIEKLSPGQYGIDWVAYNAADQVQWFAEFKRRYKPLSFFEGGVIGISYYKILKLRQFTERPALFIFGLDDCILAGSTKLKLCGLKRGGNPNPKDEYEQEPIAYFKTEQLKIIETIQE